MKRVVETIARFVSKTPLLGVVLAAFVFGYLFKGVVSSTPQAGTPVADARSDAQTEGDAEAEVWTCSMHPQIRLPEPGKCPICGMDLIRAEVASGSGGKKSAKAKKTPKYACSMFCVPPMPNPGKCPICGMEMVEVDMGQGGDDLGEAPTLVLSAAARKLAEVQTAEVERRLVSTEIRMVGKIDYDETRVRYITAWVPGRLDRLYVDYTGVPVKKGEHLVYLYSPELSQAQTELLQALDRVGQAQSGSSSIVNDRADQWLEDIRDKFRLWGLSDEQIVEIEQRGTPSDYMTIYAPMSGIVIHKNALEGMYVQTGTRIYTIADLSQLWVKLDAYESDLVWLRYGQEVEFQTEAYPGEVFAGTIAFIDPVLNDRTRTIKVRVNVGNAEGRLKPGMFVRALVRSKVDARGRAVDAELAGMWMCPMHPEVIQDDPGDCDRCGMPLVRTESLGFVSPDQGDAEPPLVIPASAPLITGKRALVYVEVPGEPGTYQGREVVLGPRAGDRYIVREGLAEGELVVVNGNFKIDSALQLMAESSMMSPLRDEAAVGKDGAKQAGSGDSGEATFLPAQRDLDGQGWKALDVPAAFGALLDPVFAAYLDIQRALSHDEQAEAIAAANKLGEALAAMDMGVLSGRAHEVWMTEADGIGKSAGRIGGAGGIEEARAGFALLSESMIAVAKRFGGDRAPVHRFHCPMAFAGRGADWLQAKERTENPYFGSAMFRCGTMTETIGPNPKESSTGGAGDER